MNAASVAIVAAQLQLGVFYFGTSFILFALFVYLARLPRPPSGTTWFAWGYGLNVLFIALGAVYAATGIAWLPYISLTFGSIVYALLLGAACALAGYSFQLKHVLGLSLACVLICASAFVLGATPEQVVALESLLGGIGFLVIAGVCTYTHRRDPRAPFLAMAIPAFVIGIHYLDYAWVAPRADWLAWARLVMELLFVWFALATMIVVQRKEHLQRQQAEKALQDVLAGLEQTVAQRTDDLRREVSVRQAAEQEALQAKTAAEAANRAKSLFLSTISHEIRTPLTGVAGSLELLTLSPLNAEQRRMTGTMLDATKALKTLVDDVLDFAKIEAGRMELERIEFSVAESVEEVAALMAPTARVKGVDVWLSIDPQLPARVLGDPLRLRQLLTNLINNAIKFTSSSAERTGRVEINVTQAADAGDNVLFLVSDNGVGMDEATLGRLFQPFTQADSSTTRRFGGTGLGLAICQTLTNLMGGSISVNSREIVGSNFELTLPLPTTLACMPRAHELEGVPLYWLAAAGGRLDLHEAQFVAWGLETTVIISVAALAGELSRAAKRPAVVLIGSQVSAAVREAAASFARRSGGDMRWIWLTRSFASVPTVTKLWSASVAANPALPTVIRETLLAAVRGEALAAAHLDAHAFNGARMAQAKPALEKADGSTQTVLVAEDNLVNQEVIGSMLRHCGAAVVFANNGREAYGMWQRGIYGLVLTDLHMPEMDGYGLARAIRTAEQRAGDGDAKSGHTPIVALTADALTEVAAQCRDAGMDECLVKPVALIEVERLLRRYFVA